eukprot:TRINITY_DN15419_c0_g1_i1.p1 TRINITY_DN15419_c0_g1~~TRINITY_DN15419_c0_g1_i1.p1  ORF type:complete len:593 (-),score=94.52 TRINITY_DN15419_c0_g1_i1:29-1807(-)
MTGSRSEPDENLVQAILATNPSSNQLYILDCRPNTNAKVNKVKSGGYVNLKHYPNCVLEFLGIENIHVVQMSLGRVCALLKKREESNWLSAFQATGWPAHIRSIILASLRVVQVMKSGASCLIHCSDGWDRTSQVSSLAQLIQDPYYRTLKGFQVLISKEWLAFGHKFGMRCGTSGSRAERSPIFIQWLECVYQLYTQNPSAFQFSVDLLLFLSENVYACRFGNFLLNSMQERDLNCLKFKTPSIWSYVHSNKNHFKNVFYTQADTISVSASFKVYSFWAELFWKYSQTAMNSAHNRRVLESHYSRMASELQLALIHIKKLERHADHFSDEDLLPDLHENESSSSEDGQFSSELSSKANSPNDNEKGAKDDQVPLPSLNIQFDDHQPARRLSGKRSQIKKTKDKEKFQFDVFLGSDNLNVGARGSMLRNPVIDVSDKGGESSFLLNRKKKMDEKSASMPNSLMATSIDQDQISRVPEPDSSMFVSSKSSSDARNSLISTNPNHKTYYDQSFRVQRPTWIPDLWVDSCQSCKKKFNQITRKHHCRSCGNIFCNHCSLKRTHLPHYKYTKPVRVCNACHTISQTDSVTLAATFN